MYLSNMEALSVSSQRMQVRTSNSKCGENMDTMHVSAVVLWAVAKARGDSGH